MNSIHENIVWDNHACMPLRPNDISFLPRLEMHHKAGFDVVSLNIGFADQSWEQHLDMAKSFRDWVFKNHENYLLVTNTDDIFVAKKTNRLGIFFDVEGSKVIEGKLERVSQLYDLGVRWMSLAYNHSNIYAGGCLPDEDSGLTSAGRALLTEMQNVGMLTCCSHTGLRTAAEAIEYCTQPTIFSHSNCSALWNHPRNIPDEIISLCASKGGVIGVSGVGAFIQKSGADVTSWIKHVEHIINLVGSEHVGIGLDYVFDQQEMIEYLEQNPALFASEDRRKKQFPIISPSQLVEMYEGLNLIGLDQGSIDKVLGGNFMRVASQVWKRSSVDLKIETSNKI